MANTGRRLLTNAYHNHEPYPVLVDPPADHLEPPGVAGPEPTTGHFTDMIPGRVSTGDGIGPSSRTSTHRASEPCVETKCRQPLSK